MTTATKVALSDIEKALNDDRHLGWGYASRDELSTTAARDQLDRNVVAVANELGLGYEDFFAWTNSKYGRWLVDAASSPKARTRSNVRSFLNAEAIQTLREGR